MSRDSANNDDDHPSHKGYGYIDSTHFLAAPHNHRSKHTDHHQAPSDRSNPDKHKYEDKSTAPRTLPNPFTHHYGTAVESVNEYRRPLHSHKQSAAHGGGKYFWTDGSGDMDGGSGRHARRVQSYERLRPLRSILKNARSKTLATAAAAGDSIGGRKQVRFTPDTSPGPPVGKGKYESLNKKNKRQASTSSDEGASSSQRHTTANALVLPPHATNKGHADSPPRGRRRHRSPTPLFRSDRDRTVHDALWVFARASIRHRTQRDEGLRSAAVIKSGRRGRERESEEEREQEVDDALWGDVRRTMRSRAHVDKHRCQAHDSEREHDQRSGRARSSTSSTSGKQPDRAATYRQHFRGPSPTPAPPATPGQGGGEPQHRGSEEPSQPSASVQIARRSRPRRTSPTRAEQEHEDRVWRFAREKTRSSMSSCSATSSPSSTSSSPSSAGTVGQTPSFYSTRTTPRSRGLQAQAERESDPEVVLIDRHVRRVVRRYDRLKQSRVTKRDGSSGSRSSSESDSESGADDELPCILSRRGNRGVREAGVAAAQGKWEWDFSGGRWVWVV